MLNENFHLQKQSLGYHFNINMMENDFFAMCKGKGNVKPLDFFIMSILQWICFYFTLFIWFDLQFYLFLSVFWIVECPIDWIHFAAISKALSNLKAKSTMKFIQDGNKNWWLIQLLLLIYYVRPQAIFSQINSNISISIKWFIMWIISQFSG